MKIARVTEPRDKITREDLMILRKSKKKKNGKANTQTNSYSQQTFKASF